MRQLLNYISPLFPFLAGWIFLLVTPNFSEIALLNGVLQLLLFALVVCLPTWKTGRMSYVDIGWPWGLVVIGLVTYIYHQFFGNNEIHFRTVAVSVVYIFIGVRMGFGAIKLWRMGHLKTELPRYEYQKQRWNRAGKNNTAIAMQVEAILQGLANASFLAVPAFVIATNTNDSVSVFEITGLAIWLAAFTFETVADAQKLSFLRQMKKLGKKNTVCNIGLWKYSRHPNYFSEWMVWNALVIASIPSWLELYNTMPIVSWSLLGLALLLVSRFMYTTLVHYTGAVPAEYYSVLKRPEYKTYQQETNRFFPGPRK